MALVFGSYDYKLSLHLSEPPFVLNRFYQEPLNRTEINEVAQKVARFFLDGIKKNTDGFP